jgi:hypothetical protein
MHDLGTQIRAHYERLAPAIDIESVADRMDAQSRAFPPRRPRRALAIALIAAVVTVLTIGIPLLLVSGGDETPVAPTSPPPTTPAVTSTAPVPSTSTAQSTDAPLPTTEVPAAWVTFSSSSGVPAGSIHQLLAATDGSVWAIGDGISRFGSSVGWEPIALPEGFVLDGPDYPIGRRSPVRAVAAADGAVWFAHPGGIHRFRDGVWTDFGTPREPDCMPTCGPSTIAVTGDGSVWIAAADHVYVLEEDSWQRVAEDFSISDTPGNALGGVNELVTGSDGSLWYSTFDEVVRFDGSEVIASPYGFEVPWRWTQVLAGDARGRAWVVVGYTEADRYLTLVADMTVPSGAWPRFALGDASSIAIAPNGDVWVAVATTPIDPWDGELGLVEPVTDPGAYRFDGNQWTHYTVADGLADTDVVAVTVATDGTVWFSTGAGISRFDPSGAATDAPRADVGS